MKRFNRRAGIQDISWGTLLGGITLVILIAGVGLVMLTGSLKIVSDFVMGGVTSVANPPSIFTRASTSNFERLNQEIGFLLKDSRKTAGTVIPFSMGQYRLVGFNRDTEDGLNKVCLSPEIVSAKEQKCKDKACLCLCQKEEKCSCEVYPGVDYFITKDDFHRYIGKEISGVLDPVTGQPAYCLYIKGADSEETDLKVFDDYSDWFKATNLYVEKTEKGGNTYIFIDNYDDVKYGSRVRLATGGGTGTGTGGGVSPDDLPTDRCSEIASCLDYKELGIWGADWVTACDSSICQKAGSSLNCSVADNPAAKIENVRMACIDSDKTLAKVCLRNETEGYPYGMWGGYAKDLTNPAICLECRGVGGLGANDYGWFDGVDPVLCEPAPAAP